MSFLYPLFLLAGLSLVIPVLIHLFNLRKYKTVFFPHTRFLKNIQLSSRKQSQVRYKWLLTARLLFLAFLIFAFAQPFFNNGAKTDNANKLQVIYIDNSYSMSVKKGARTLLDIAREAATRQTRQARPGSKFLLLTNDQPKSYHPETAEQALMAINAIDLSANNKTANEVLATVQSILQSEGGKSADVYYYSDFQQHVFPSNPDAGLMRNITFYGLPTRAEEPENIYIDTAFLTTPVLQTGKSNYLVARVKRTGKAPKERPVLTLAINGQVKTAASLDLSDKEETEDTLAFNVNDANWQCMTLSVNDASVRFDDTFRVTARSSPNLAVLVINEGQPNPYIQAAFRAYNGFRLNNTDATAAPKGWKEYNLVILNGVTRIDAALGKTLADALLQGQTICVFPGRTADIAGLNEGLRMAGDIKITGMDTAAQTASSLQQGSALVKDLFEKIPDNVQLPVANWHYIVSAGLSANQQSVLGFRNGDPLLARYTPTKGQLYISAVSADPASGNFPASYFFTPFLYEMAMQSGGGSVYALTVGGRQSVYLPLNNATERNTVHLYASGLDVIPPQRPSGAGLDVFADEVTRQPGFYSLTAPGSGDTARIALNQDKSESLPETRGMDELKKTWAGGDIHWLSIADNGNVTSIGNEDHFPLWKVCVILALLMLAMETFLLARKQTA